MGSRTKINLVKVEGFWEKVQTWAKEEKFYLKNDSGLKKIYQKGKGFWVAPMLLEFSESGSDVELEVYIYVGLFVKIMSLFMLPTEMGVTSGGLRLMLPRKIAREAVNRLLIRLDAQNQTIK